MTNFEYVTLIPSILKTINIGKYCLPNPRLFDELVNAPKLDVFLVSRFWAHYRMSSSTISSIKGVMDRQNPDTLWNDILKVIKEDLSSRDSKLLYILFSLQKYRFPQTSINFDSTEYLIAWSNRTIVKIEDELKARIQNPLKADKILKTFHERKGVEWEEYLYNDLAIKYLMTIQPSPVGMMNNINHDYTFNSIGRSKSTSEIQKHVYEREIKNIEDRINKPGNEMWKMEFTDELEVLKTKIIRLELDMSLPQHLDTYSSRCMECVRRLDVVFLEAYYLIENDKKLSLLLHNECPEYFVALADKQLAGINRKNLKRSTNTEPQLRLCQCQFCYEYRSEELSASGEYPWHCDRADCQKQYESWVKHLNRLSPHPIKLSSVYRDG